LEYAIETKSLVKKYPTSAKNKGRGRGRRGHEGGIRSLTGIIDAIKGIRGPFIDALDGVDLSIRRGEIFGILGPNGAGKTTLIKVLCTLVLHDGGEAYVNGFDVGKEPSKVLENLQAVLPGSRGFNWRLTGRQNLEFYALLYGLDDDVAKKRIGNLLELTGLEEMADDGYQRYSTGMQRKLLLCRGLLRDTPILLFDEPTTGLDPHAAADFRSLLRDRLVKEEGKTILASTHNLYEAQEICDRIAILDRGKITACDTPDNIRYIMFDENTFNVTFWETVYTEEHTRMLDELQEVSGIYGATPQVGQDGSFEGIAFRVDKNIDLSATLEIILKRGLRIRTVNTEEPTLEEAFIAITGKLPAQPRRRRR